MATARVTITLPDEVVSEIDRLERNRSRFVLEAVRRELVRRRRAELQRSLEAPHPESSIVAEAGLEQWGAQLPDDDAADLVDLGAGTALQWSPDHGWKEEP